MMLLIIEDFKDQTVGNSLPAFAGIKRKMENNYVNQGASIRQDGTAARNGTA